MKIDGEFTYEVDGEKVKSVDEFYKLTNNKNYNLVIDGLNIVATSKSEPFFLDEFVGISFSPKTSKKQNKKLELLRDTVLRTPSINFDNEELVKIMYATTKEELKNILRLNIKSHCPNLSKQKYEELENTLKVNVSICSPNYTTNDTGGSIFEKVQDSTLPPHLKEYNLKPIHIYGLSNEDQFKLEEKGTIMAEKISESLFRRGKITDYSKNGKKHNEGKLPIDTMITVQFPKAIQALAKATLFGHNKYKETDEDWLNYKRVLGGSQTYADASARHGIDKNVIALDSGLPHIYHKAWNVMAELELWIEENENK